ncbi:spore cortex-lytic enzyme [Brevibacillus ginsengisoli]|uniref:spore cortex-lytic enzyme n=1 Tax=Brevibacillus ginsengisoli TaxID=363854 RepID=UPI003CE94B0F
MQKKKLVLLLSLLLCSALTITAVLPTSIQTFSQAIREVGSSGDDIIEMQGRLKLLGFYTGPIDGQFSWRSYWALRNFQYEFGLPIDGVLGPQTKVKLYNATTHYRPGEEEGKAGLGQRAGAGAGVGAGAGAGAAPAAPAAPAPKPVKHTSKVSDNDLKLLANAVYGEARGEPYIGQVAIAAVIMNRTRNPDFPDTPSGVIFEPGAFTAVSDGQIWLTPNETAKKAVQDALNGWDPSSGATYYFNPDTATSAWIWSRPQIKKIGRHIFCR